MASFQCFIKSFRWQISSFGPDKGCWWLDIKAKWKSFKYSWGISNLPISFSDYGIHRGALWAWITIPLDVCSLFYISVVCTNDGYFINWLNRKSFPLEEKLQRRNTTSLHAHGDTQTPLLQEIHEVPKKRYSGIKWCLTRTSPLVLIACNNFGWASWIFNLPQLKFSHHKIQSCRTFIVWESLLQLQKSKPEMLFTVSIRSCSIIYCFLFKDLLWVFQRDNLTAFVLF